MYYLFEKDALTWENYSKNNSTNKLYGTSHDMLIQKVINPEQVSILSYWNRIIDWCGQLIPAVKNQLN